MTDFNTTADALDRMAVQQQAMTDAAAAFRALGSIEGTTKGLQEQNKAALVALTNTNKALAVAEEKRQEAERQAGLILEQAQDDAAAIEGRAEEDAAEVRREATATHKKLIADGEAKALAYGEAVKKEWAITKEHLESARAEIAAAREEKAAIAKEVAEAQTKLDTINKTLRDMLGAK